MIKNCTIRGGRRADVCFRWVRGGGEIPRRKGGLHSSAKLKGA